MKGKDIAIIGGVGFLFYLLLKPKAGEAEKDGAPTFISNLFGGGGAPGIVPEIDIPEFVMPDWGFLPEVPDWEGMLPDWESMLPDWDKLLDPFNLFDGGNGRDKIDIDLIPDVNIVVPKLTVDDKGIAEAAGDLLGSIIAFPTNVINQALDVVNWPWRIDTGAGRLDETPESYRAESEAIFELAGISEVTPNNLDRLISAREAITGEKAEELPPIGSPDYLFKMLGSPAPYQSIQPGPRYSEYDADMALLAKNAPFLLTKDQLERYG